MRICSIEGCGMKHRAKNYCSTHYNRTLVGINDMRPERLPTNYCGFGKGRKQDNSSITPEPLMHNEEWRPIQDFPAYAVSNLGRVKRIKISIDKRWKPGGFLNSYIDEMGYLRVHLRRNNKSYIRRIHVLVSNAFLEKIPDQESRHHKDGNKKNNISSNLTFISLKEHGKIHG